MSPEYAGDPLEVSDQAKDFDGVTVLSPTVGASADVAFFDASAVQIGTTAAMTWNGTRQRWIYVWDTAGAHVAPGNYRARVRVYDALGRHTRTWIRIRLSADPIVVS